MVPERLNRRRDGAGHGTVTVRSRFEDFTGRFVLHGHILNREDIGMVQVVEVYAS